jgi:uroporphyrinogen-III synthase
VVLYEARPAEALTKAAKAALADGTLDAALFFSPRTATTFVNLIVQARLEPAARRVAAVCLSAAVAEAARVLDWRAIRIAARPDQAALLDEVERECRARTPDR